MPCNILGPKLPRKFESGEKVFISLNNVTFVSHIIGHPHSFLFFSAIKSQFFSPSSLTSHVCNVISWCSRLAITKWILIIFHVILVCCHLIRHLSQIIIQLQIQICYQQVPTTVFNRDTLSSSGSRISAAHFPIEGHRIYESVQCLETTPSRYLWTSG